MVDFRVADTAPEHPKLRAAGLVAAGLWSLAGAYSMRELTDGWVPAHWVGGWPGGGKAATRLVAVGLWEPEVRDGQRGYRFHDFLDYQRRAEAVLKDRQEGRERARRSRERSAERSALRSGEPKVRGQQKSGNEMNLPASWSTAPTPFQQQDQGSAPAPGPAETPERSPERSANVRDSLSLTRALGGGYVGGESSSWGARGAQKPPPRCPEHSQLPDGLRPPPCGACKELRVAAEGSTADEVLAELAARTARRAAIDACPLCDDNGMRDLGDSVARCAHAGLEAVS